MKTLMLFFAGTMFSVTSFAKPGCGPPSASVYHNTHYLHDSTYYIPIGDSIKFSAHASSGSYCSGLRNVNIKKDGVFLVSESSFTSDYAYYTLLAESGEYEFSVFGDGFATRLFRVLPENTTGIYQNTMNQFKLSPVPVINILTISAEEDNISQIDVLNTNGQLLQTSQATLKSTQVDFTNYPKGFYLVRIRDDKNRYKSYMVVKE